MTNAKKMTSAASDIGAKLRRAWTAVSPVGRILTFSPADDKIALQKNLSIALDKGNISIAYGSRFLSKISITDIKQYSFEENRYPEPEDLISSLALVDDFNPANADITLSIPKAWTIIRTVEFPSTVKENIPDVLSYELDRLTPFTAADAFFDFSILGEKEDRISLLLLAAKTEQIRPYIDILKERGLTVSAITVNLSAIGAYCRYMDKKSDALFVEISDKGYEGGLFLNGLPAHNFSGRLAGLDDNAKIDSITAEIKTLMNAARDQDKAPQVVVHLKDKSPATEGLLKSRLGMPVRIMGEMGVGLGLQTHKEIPFAAVGGVIQSLWAEADGLNLLKKGRHEKQKTPMALTVLLLIFMASLWIFYLIAPLRTGEIRLQQISGQIGQKKEEVKKVEDLKKEAESLSTELALINNFKHDRIMTLDIMKELTTILPKSAWLTRIKITATSVDIEGYAGTATELLPKLEASKYFGKVEFASSTMRDTRMNADRFNIRMEIENAKNSAGGKSKDEKK
ncbi:MAG: PilN domain-containing protein [Nitrospirae bacterium]|nr:PilN domain-containing protein [Nitrospirota bacterium]